MKDMYDPSSKTFSATNLTLQALAPDNDILVFGLPAPFYYKMGRKRLPSAASSSSHNDYYFYWLYILFS